LVVTAGSFAYNAFTAGRSAPPAGLTYVQAGDVKTRYREWGTTGSPIVLVHGAFESADTWSRLAPLLARDHRVYALDLTGYGYSQRKGPYTAVHEASQLLGFLDALHLERAVVVAHSSGAAIAAEATLRAQPGKVSGLMFLDGDALASGAGSRSPIRYLLIDPYRTSIFRLGLRSDWIIRMIYSRQCGPGCPHLDKAGVDSWRRPFQQPGAEGGVWAMLSEGVPGLPISRLEELRRLRLPKAIVFGSKDDVFSKASPRQTAARIGAPPPILIEGAHHLGMISAPQAVATAVETLAVRSVDFR
jgi:pimeloyl-ACP methyl ester carboxylesterase